VKKVLLLIDCDSCRCLYEFTRLASEDTTAWDVHGRALVQMALQSGWAGSQDDNFQYCPDCVRQLEEECQFYLECH